MKFNLQHFAQVIDAAGNVVEEKKKKKVVTLPTVPKVGAPTATPTIPVATPFVSSREAAAAGTAVNPNTGEKLGTFEEGEAQQEKLRADFQAELAARTATPDKTVATPTVPTGPTSDEINAQLQAATIDKLLRNLNTAIDAKRGAIEEEKSAIAGGFRTAEGQLRTEDTMARAGRGKFLDIGGQAVAGSKPQTATSLEVLRQGRLGDLNQQELEQRASIERRLSELEVELAQGILDIESDVERQNLESQLRSAEAQEEYEREKAVLAESREYDDYLRQIENADDREVTLFEQELLERNKEIDFEIKEAIANNDLVREKELTADKAAIDLQLEAVRQSGRLSLESARAANTATEIGLRGDEARETAEFKEGLDSGELKEADTFKPTITTIAKAISTAVGDTDLLDEAEVKDKTLEWIMQNEDLFIGDVNLLQETMLRTGISERELEEYETWRENVLANEAFQ